MPRRYVAIDLETTGLDFDRDTIMEVGAVRFDPQAIEQAAIELTFDASALKVTGKGEPPADVPKVQQVMVSGQVLDVATHPVIVFRSQQIRVRTRSAGQWRLQVAGELTLRGTTRPISGLVEVEISADRLVGSGTLVVKQTSFGIQPVSAGLGMVRVKDEVTVNYRFTARR